MASSPVFGQRIEQWPIDKLVFHARNSCKNDAADRMCGSIREFGFKIPCLQLRWRGCRSASVAESGAQASA
jgi:hypothetical protein